jgi:zinc and cadmium transporter
MLGIGLLRLMPHSAVLLPTFDHVSIWVTIGLLIMFITLRMFHFHQHSLAEVPVVPPLSSPNLESGSNRHTDETTGHALHKNISSPEIPILQITHPHIHDHDHDHDHGNCQSLHDQPAYHPHHHHQGCAHDPQANTGSWTAILLGLTLHTILDGFALGASIQAAIVTKSVGLYGLGTFLAVLLHKPLDTMTLGALMSNDGISLSIRRLVVVGFSLICPAAMILALAGLNQFSYAETYLLGAALACSAGIFICIALSDLLPEIEFHSHDRLKLTSLMLAGVLTAYLVGWLEPKHSHMKPPLPPTTENGNLQL